MSSFEVDSALDGKVSIQEKRNHGVQSIVPEGMQAPTVEARRLIKHPNWDCALSSLSNPLVSIDSIRLYMKNKQTIRTDSLEPQETKSNHSTGMQTTRYSYANLQVEDRNSCFIVYGSVPVFLHGQNLTPTRLEEFRFFLEEMSEVLSLDLCDSQVSRLDLSANLLMEYPCYQYFPILNSSFASSRTIINNESLYFLNKSTTLIFYDKSNETLNHNVKGIPLEMAEFLQKHHILRYELQLKKGSAIKPSICARELCQSDTFCSFVDTWKCKYDHIAKDRSYLPRKKDEIGYHSLQAIQHDLFLQHYGGIERFGELLESWVQGGEITRRKKSSLKQRYLQSLGSIDDSFGAVLVDELSSKVEVACQITLATVK